MRIISGNFKGKKILKPKNLITRPLKDLTKESIVNIINHSNKFSIDLQKSTVLDLFSGVGSFGIECLSRGAKHVTFVDNYSGVTEVLKKNLGSLSNINNYEILQKDIIQDLQFINFKKKFDIIFLDPPYKLKELSKILKNIYEQKCLKSDGILIIHRHKKEVDLHPKKFKILEEKKYGISKIIFGLFID